MADKDSVSTDSWAILFGGLIGAMAFIQFGEAIYTFTEINERQDLEINQKMYMTSLQQLIMSLVAVLVAIFALVLWKMDKIQRPILLAFAFFAFLTSAFVLAVLLQHRISWVDNRKQPTEAERAFAKRSSNLMYGNMGLFGLIFAMSLLMIWLNKYGDDKKYFV